MIERSTIPDHATPPTVASVNEFAALLGARYGTRSYVASGADLALAFESHSESPAYYASQRIEIAPRISIDQNYAFSSWSETAAAESPAALDETRATALFERLFTRHARFTPLDSPRDPAPASASKQLSALLAERVSVIERVLPARGAAPTPGSPAPDATPASHKPDPGWGTPFTPRETPAPKALPAPEIRRVADQVMREIDHRARAIRERTGRMAR